MSNREEIQITDLEPSIEGGDDVEYIVQIRGIDASGRPGPWSDELKFTSPQQIPSLQSFNYVPGEGGWRLDNDGSFEVNDGTIRGTLESFNYVPGVSGWQLDPDGFAEFDTGIFRGALRIGQNTFNVDTNGNLFIGGTSPQNAPFSVDTTGTILAMNIDAGFITAGTIGADVVYAGELVASQITSGTLDAVRIPNLAASKITSGTFAAVRIPNLSTDKITSGTFDAVRIPNLSADIITSGTFDAVRIPNLSADKITSGTMSANRISGGTISGISITGSTITGTAITTNTNMFAPGYRVIDSEGNTTSSFFGLSLTTAGNANINGQIINGLSSGEPIMASATSTLNAQSVFIRIASPNNGRLFRFSSSIKYKKDIVDAPLYDIENLRPVLFRSTLPDDGDQINFGLIAEEVAELNIPGLASYSENGPEGVSMELVGLVLVNHVKELYGRIEELERKLNGS